MVTKWPIEVRQKIRINIFLVKRKLIFINFDCKSIIVIYVKQKYFLYIIWITEEILGGHRNLMYKYLILLLLLILNYKSYPWGIISIFCCDISDLDNEYFMPFMNIWIMNISCLQILKI
jgi:hypothetical protein